RLQQTSHSRLRRVQRGHDRPQRHRQTRRLRARQGRRRPPSRGARRCAERAGLSEGFRRARLTRLAASLAHRCDEPRGYNLSPRMKPGTTKTKWEAIACALALCGSVPARAQTLPSEPIVFADGRVTFGGDVSASFAPKDTGYFNYTDYEHSALRLLRIDFTGSLKAGDHLAVLGEVRSENVESPRPYALFLRIRPWTARQFDIQVG